MTAKISGMRVEFSKNGTMTSSTGVEGGSKTRTWEFIEDEMAVKSVMGDDKKEKIMDIIELSDDSLTIKERGKENAPAMVLMPAKD